MKLFYCLVLLAFCSTLSAQKIGTIDMDKTFLKYYKTIAAEKKLKSQVKNLEDRAAQMERKHKELISEYQQLLKDGESVLLSEEVRKKKREEAETKQAEIQSLERTMRNFNKDARGMLADQHNGSRGDILKEIQGVIDLIAKNKSLDLVLDTSGKTSNLISGVVYNKGTNDITNEVIAILNKGHEKEVEDHEKEKAEKEAAQPAKTNP